MSKAATELCVRTYFPEFNDCIMIVKRVKINNATSLNVYDSPSFSSQLIVFCQGREYSWLTLKISSIKTSGLREFSA
jgi:hypothetical protein